VIFGVDVMTEHQFLVYGRDVLKEIMDTGKGRSLRVLRIGLDQETEELEKLLALVELVRGRHDYQSYEE
jgi:hypothetical protein